jgi:hypothetical protein
MAQDADGNYYYDEGTVAEQFDNWEVYEDSDGNVGFYNGSGEFRLHELAFAFGGQRAEPTTDELADGEYLVYVADGNGANAAGDVVAARNNSSSIETAVIVGAASFS